MGKQLCRLPSYNNLAVLCPKARLNKQQHAQFHLTRSKSMFIWKTDPTGIAGGLLLVLEGKNSLGTFLVSIYRFFCHTSLVKQQALRRSLAEFMEEHRLAYSRTGQLPEALGLRSIWGACCVMQCEHR
jgi:hypothetical protein